MNEDSYKDELGRTWIWNDGKYKIIEELPVWRYFAKKTPKKKKKSS